MTKISGLSANNGNALMCSRLRILLCRLVPERALLAEARAMFSSAAISRAAPATAKNLLYFLEGLYGLNVNSHYDFTNRLQIKGLEAAPTGRPETIYADNVRQLLSYLDCSFAYQNNHLVIGSTTEVAAGLASGTLSYTRTETPAYVPVIAPVEPRPVAAPSTSALEVVRRAGTSSPAQRRIESDQEVKNIVIDLLRSGQPEMAATILFSNPERTVVQSLKIISDVAKEDYIFDGYEGIVSALKLQKDLHDTQLTELRSDNETLLLAYLLGRYASVAPVLAAQTVDSMVFSRLGLVFNLNQLIEIMAYMEKPEYRANLVLGLASLGKARITKAIDSAYAMALDESHALLHFRFQTALDCLHAADRECFFSSAEVREGSAKTIFRDPNNITVTFVQVEEPVEPDSQALVVYNPKKQVHTSLSRDAHLRVSVKELLEAGQSELAAVIAFTGYVNPVLRFANLNQLGFQQLGRLIGAAEPAKRAKALVDLSFALDEKNHELGEEVALAMLWLGGEEDLDRAAACYHELVEAEQTSPGTRFAARKLLLTGSYGHQTAGDYGLVYDALEAQYPETYKYDYRQFTEKGTEGCFSAVDAPLEGIKERILAHYYNILTRGTLVASRQLPEKERVIAANMLGRLGATKFFPELLTLAKGQKDLEDRTTPAIFRAVAAVYGKLDKTDKKQNKWAIEFERDCLTSSGKNADFFTRLVQSNPDADSLPALRFTLKDANPNWRKETIALLGTWQDTLSLPALRAILSDTKDNLEVRKSAATALGKFVDPSLSSIFLELAGNPLEDQGLRIIAINNLGTLKDMPAVPVLRELLINSEILPLAAAAACSLCAIGGNDVIEVFDYFRQIIYKPPFKEKGSLQEGVAKALTTCPDPTPAQSFLRTALLSGSEESQLAAVQCFAKTDLFAPHPGFVYSPSAFDLLMGHIRHCEHPFSSVSAAIATLSTCGSQVISLFHEALNKLREERDIRDDLGRRSLYRVKYGTAISRRIVEALAKVGGIEALSNVLYDLNESHEVIITAVHEAKKIKDQSAVSLLEKALKRQQGVRIWADDHPAVLAFKQTIALLTLNPDL